MVNPGASKESVPSSSVLLLTSTGNRIGFPAPASGSALGAGDRARTTLIDSTSIHLASRLASGRWDSNSFDAASIPSLNPSSHFAISPLALP